MDNRVAIYEMLPLLEMSEDGHAVALISPLGVWGANEGLKTPQGASLMSQRWSPGSLLRRVAHFYCDTCALLNGTWVVGSVLNCWG